MNILQALTLRGELDSYERQENAWLLAHILNCSALELKLISQQQLTATQQHDYLSGLQRLAEGEPLAYITGSQPFWTLDLKVSTATLVPRPDTEILVETALKLALADHSQVLDLGTGTGAIALALASERPTWHIIATDISSKSLDIAQQNAQLHQLTQVEFYCGSWFEALKQHNTQLPKFHLIVSNPPYIDAQDEHLQDLKTEPRRALVADQQGLADLMTIIQQAPHYLQSQGWLIVEHGFEQGQAVRQLFVNAGFQQIQTVQDYGGNERISLGQWY